MSFWEALLGLLPLLPDMKLDVIKGRSHNLQEAMVYDTEVNVVIEAKSRKSSQRLGEVRMVGFLLSISYQTFSHGRQAVHFLPKLSSG